MTVTTSHKPHKLLDNQKRNDATQHPRSNNNIPRVIVTTITTVRMPVPPM